MAEKKGLTKPKELGKYTEGPRGGGRRQHQGGRPVEEVEVARKCGGCGKHISKAKTPLVCSCKREIHCNKVCQQSSNHSCQREQRKPENYEDKQSQQIAGNCYARYLTDRDLNRGPSSEKVKALMKRTRGDDEHLMVLAECGDPVAAYLVGTAYAERRACSKKGCKGKVEHGFTMPSKCMEKGIPETTEIAIKWLKVAAEGGVPEAMFLLAMKLLEDSDLVVDKRVAHHWLAQAHSTGKMEYIIDLLESDGFGLAAEFENMSRGVAHIGGHLVVPMFGPTLANLLLAARWQELRDWGGKTAMAEPFYGRRHFNAFMETMGGDLTPADGRLPCFAHSDKKSISLIFISGRPGSCDVTRHVVSKERNENNTKFKQGVKAETNPDYQLCVQTLDENGYFSPPEGRTMYLITCKHNQTIPQGEKQVYRSGGNVTVMGDKFTKNDLSKYKGAGECQPCVTDALSRLRSVAKGLYSVSLTQIIPDYGYAARYVNNDGVIVQDIFKAYSKPDARQGAFHLDSHHGISQGNHREDENNEFHNYYQWVCFMLFLQAIFFYFPYMTWKNVEKGRMKKMLMKIPGTGEKADSAITDAPLDEQVAGLAKYVFDNKESYDGYARWFLLCEIANLLNVFAQIYLMDTFLGGKFLEYGKSFFAETRDNFYFNAESVFPKVTKCTMPNFGASGKVVYHSGICTLPVNILNEKIYVFMFVWMMMLALVSIVHCIMELFIIVFPVLRKLSMATRMFEFGSGCRLAHATVDNIIKNSSYGFFVILRQTSKNMEPPQFKALLATLGKYFEPNSNPLTPFPSASSSLQSSKLPSATMSNTIFRV